MTDITRLTRIRHGVRAVLTLAIAASIAANVLHARPDWIARSISAWPPVALLLAVELISRVPVHSRVLPAIRLSATGVIAGIAAWVSYWHMAEVAAGHGEGRMSAHLIPFSVDGLIVVTSICLVELGARPSVTATVGVAPTLEVALDPTGVGAAALPVAPTGRADYDSPDSPVAPTPDPTGTPDPAASPVVAVDQTPDPTDAVTPLAAAADHALVKRIQRDITQGRIKPNPGADLIRKTYGPLGTERARRVRDLIHAEAAPGKRHVTSESEAANA